MKDDLFSICLCKLNLFHNRNTDITFYIDNVNRITKRNLLEVCFCQGIPFCFGNLPVCCIVHTL